MSFSLTIPQFKDRSKTVTRRLGWENLKEGQELMACEKCQGLKPGENIVRLGIIVVMYVRRIPLNILIHDPRDYDCGYGRTEMIAEGFPHLTPEQFVAMFCKFNNCKPDAMVTRITFAHAPQTP